MADLVCVDTTTSVQAPSTSEGVADSEGSIAAAPVGAPEATASGSIECQCLAVTWTLLLAQLSVGIAFVSRSARPVAVELSWVGLAGVSQAALVFPALTLPSAYERIALDVVLPNHMGILNWLLFFYISLHAKRYALNHGSLTERRYLRLSALTKLISLVSIFLCLMLGTLNGVEALASVPALFLVVQGVAHESLSLQTLGLTFRRDVGPILQTMTLLHFLERPFNSLMSCYYPHIMSMMLEGFFELFISVGVLRIGKESALSRALMTLSIGLKLASHIWSAHEYLIASADLDRVDDLIFALVTNALLLMNISFTNRLYSSFTNK